jgi:hypothetical protein
VAEGGCNCLLSIICMDIFKNRKRQAELIDFQEFLREVEEWYRTS